MFQFTEDLGVQLVVVNIADENDNGPLFAKKLYTGGNLFSLFIAIFALKCLANFIQNFLFHLKYLPPLAKNIATLGRPALLNPSILIKNAVDGEYSDKL